MGLGLMVSKVRVGAMFRIRVRARARDRGRVRLRARVWVGRDICVTSLCKISVKYNLRLCLVMHVFCLCHIDFGHDVATGREQ
jgi:hypothetical protein